MVIFLFFWFNFTYANFMDFIKNVVVAADANIYISIIIKNSRRFY